ncbi:sugar phosphate nucleotidyltransferase [Luxibacter massiliensis]|uniref:sugar phosphate nucleotidyltransferase n=1 Tax=Luxibacter massiliensis TaxID=2219695 RepID=UPI00197E158F|nr:sugar phosphate nucleotidyltransferase [Luxibacter massiliensis]
MNSSNILYTEHTVRDGIQVLDREIHKFVCIVNKNNILKGTFTQGDMRRYLLNNGDISAPITKAMNPTPRIFSSRTDALEAAKKERLAVYPIVDNTGTLIDYYLSGLPTYDVMEKKPLKEIPLVIMAGGKGTRLYPYTKVLPKALIPIGDLTISERIIQKFANWGCRDVYLILNYKGGMIKSYYEELNKDYNIHFIKEDEFLGTGGGLSLLKGLIHSTFILSNCDILVDADYDCMLKIHRSQHNLITFVAAMKDVVIPYGILSTTPDGQIKNIHEKPEMSFLTSTGIYLIEPDIINELNEGEFIHITDIAQRYLDKNEKIGAFPISGKSWLDMGQFEEMNVMLKELGIDE